MKTILLTLAALLSIAAASVPPIIAAKSGKVYHVKACMAASNIKTPVVYATVEAAVAAGLRPCGICERNSKKVSK